MNSVQVEMFPAKNGDSFLISFDNGKNIIIDMGYKETYKLYIKDRLIELNRKGQQIDLLIITHIDRDHILGAIEFIKENKYSCNPQIIKVNEIWFNSFKHLQYDKRSKEEIGVSEKRILEEIIVANSVASTSTHNESDDVSGDEGSTLASYLYGYGYNWNTFFDGEAVNLDDKDTYEIEDIKITLLSPDTLKLKRLYFEWLDFLNGQKYNFSITADKIFDDAYELYLLNLQEFIEYNEYEEIFADTNEFDLDKLLMTKPRRKDNTASNGSSIAIVIEYKGRKLLFLGDAHEDIIIKSLKLYEKKGNNMNFDIIKVPHHGSLKNNCNWMNIASGKCYLLSTDGGTHNHPDKEVLARLIYKSERKVLCFNYPIENVKNFDNEELKNRFTYSLIVGDGQNCVVIDDSIIRW